MAVPVSELQLAAPSAIIELFQLELNPEQHGIAETHYFHSGSSLNANGDIIWAGQAYQRWPIEASGFEYNGQGQLPRPTLRVSNVMAAISALILTLPNGLEGAKVSRLRTLARYLDAVNFPGSVNPLGAPDPTAEWPREVFYIDRKAAENIEAVEFEMCAVFDLAGVRAPKRQCISNICQWKYRGLECGYIGSAYFDTNDTPVATLAQDVCGKRLSSCEIRFQQLRIAGSVTAGSNVISLAQSVGLSSGDPVSGFGIQTGTTVASASGNLVVLNQAATASTNVVSAGTIQGDYASIALTSAAGIIAGMSVAGPYLGAGAQVVGVSGNVVSLSSPADPSQFLTALASTQGQLSRNRASALVPLGSLPGDFVVNRVISSVYLPLAARARITNIGTVSMSIGKFVNGYKELGLSIAPDYPDGVDPLPLVTWTVYGEISPSAATYTFSATNNLYTFRADNNLPFGSFPGVGTFFT